MGFGEMEHIGNGGEGFRVREVRGSRVLGGFCSHVSISGSRSEVEGERKGLYWHALYWKSI